jgi:hypothetical protein
MRSRAASEACPTAGCHTSPSIGSTAANATQPVYNLDVARDRDFFVGTNHLLAHDFSFVQPVLEPFDRP